MEVWMDGWMEGRKRWLYFVSSEVIPSSDNLLCYKSTSLFPFLPLKEEVRNVRTSSSVMGPVKRKPHQKCRVGWLDVPDMARD